MDDYKLLPQFLIDALNKKRALNPTEASMAGKYADPKNQVGLGDIASSLDPVSAGVRGYNQLSGMNPQDFAKSALLMQSGTLPFLPKDMRNQYVNTALQGITGTADVFPAAVIGGAGAKAGAREIARQIESGTGLFGRNIIDPRMYAYLPDTPSKPNPLVGTRFVSESQGNLVPRKDLKIENLLGANLLGKPYDNSNADKLIFEVSGEKLNKPVGTMGGDEFPMLKYNFENEIGGASNFGIANRIADRINNSRKENLLNKGTGDVIELTTTMGKNAEWFSGYPNEIYRQLILQNGSPKEIREFNKVVRNINVLGNTKLRPFGNFKGIETPEGQAQFLTGEGFDAGGTAGEFNKAFSYLMSQKNNQERFGYNQQDVINSVLNPATMNLPKGFTKEIATKTFENTKLTPSSLGSKINAYDTDYSGLYAGHLKPTPVEIMFFEPYQNIYKEMQFLHPSASPDKLRQYTLGALETRKQNVSQKVTPELIDRYYQYQEGLLGK